MDLVKVAYQHREDGTELVNHEKTLKSHHEACEIIDNYPWAKELALFEELGEGGGFFFSLGQLGNKYVSFQFTPVEQNQGLLDLEIVRSPGFLNIFGRKSVSKSFNVVSVTEAKLHLKSLFEHSVESLYEKYT